MFLPWGLFLGTAFLAGVFLAGVFLAGALDVPSELVAFLDFLGAREVAG